MSLDIKDAPVSVAAALLSRTTGKKIEVISGGDKLVSANFVNVPLGQALRVLQQGLPGASLSLDGNPVRTGRLPPDAQLSVCLTDADLSTVLAMLAEVTGARLGIAGPTAAKVTLKTQGTVAEIVAQLRAQTGTEIQIQE